MAIPRRSCRSVQGEGEAVPQGRPRRGRATALPVTLSALLCRFPRVLSAGRARGSAYPLFLYAVKDSKPGPICAGFAVLGCGVSPLGHALERGRGPSASGVINGVSGACPLRWRSRIPTSARASARVLLDTYTLLVTRRAGRWLRKMRDGRRLVLPIRACRVIARPAVSRSGAGCPCWGLGQSPFWAAIPLVAFCQLARVSRSLARAGAAGGFSALLLRPFWAALPISPGRRRSRPEGSP